MGQILISAAGHASVLIYLYMEVCFMWSLFHVITGLSQPNDCIPKPRRKGNLGGVEGAETGQSA